MRRSHTKIKSNEDHWFSESVKSLDVFYQDIEILFDNGKPKLQTQCGVVLGLFMMMLLFSQVWTKAEIMLNYKQNQIQEPTKENYFDNDYKYDSQDGWRVAFGVTGYGGELDSSPFDESIGTMQAFQTVWGENDKDGNIIP